MKPTYVFAQVTNIIPFTDTILQINLSPEHFIPYQAGQYLQILYNEELSSYSIANAPLQAKHYELHMRCNPENLYNQRLVTAIKKQRRVAIYLPLGTCSVAQLNPYQPILFIAGGTGLAPIKAMIEQLLACNYSQPLALYWGVRSQSDLYLHKQIKKWQTQTRAFHYISLLSNLHNITLADAVIKDYAYELLNWQIVISGPFDMVYATRDALIRFGIAKENLYADAFAFEK